MPKKVRHLSSSIRKAKELADALVAERDHLQSAPKESIRLQGEYAAKVEQLTAALEKIASPTQSTDLLWWQEIARTALKEQSSQQETALSKLEAGTHVLVPVEPTEAMEDAHDMAHAEAETIFAGFPDLWRAMITAAQEGQ